MTDTSRFIVCLIENDPSGVLVVAPALHTHIRTLKKLIQRERKKSVLGDIDSDELVLWKLKVPVPIQPETTLPERIGFKNLPISAEILTSLGTVSNVFPEPIPEGDLYLVATLPPRLKHSSVTSITHEMLARRIEYAERFPNIAPSSLGQPSTFLDHQMDPDGPVFYFDRPATAAATIPVSLLHPIFGQFMDDCAEHVPVEEDTKLALEMSSAMSKFYGSEKERMLSFRTVMTDNDLEMEASFVAGTNFATDGDMRTNSFCYCLVEGKNEIGSKGAEPIFQAGGYYSQLMLEKSKKYPYARLPILLIYAMGAHIGFVGAVWTSQPNMQVLVNPLALFFHHTDIKNRTVVAQYLGAMKKAICSLRTHYDRKSFLSTLDSTDQPDFPYQREYTSLLDGMPHSFRYKAQLTNKLVFVGNADDGGELCIKFVHSYSKETHLKCADLGFAPSLRGFENLPGGWAMVVMDQIDNSFRTFRECKPTTTLYERLKRDITNLHQATLVHGDIRDVNLLVRESDERLMLVDFDWAGSIGKVRYPLFLNREEIWRPDDARDGGLILADHDIQMLDHMFGK